MKTRFPEFLCRLAGFLLCCMLFACGGSGGGSSANDLGLGLLMGQGAVPVANAGSAQSVLVGSSVTLDGSGSTTVLASGLSYRWTLVSKPDGSAAALSDDTAVRPVFVADLAGRYVISLTVSDGSRSSEASSVTVTASVADLVPLANAGSAQSVLVGSTVKLDGSGSSDADGNIASWRWTLSQRPEGSAAVLSNPAVMAPEFVADRAGTYVASLVVNDGELDSEAATVTITASVANAVPVANAGSMQTVTAGDTVTLDGSASSDADGDSLSWAWSFNSRPAGSAAALSGASSAHPVFVADVAGTYVAQLVVSDARAASTPATVSVIASVLNIAPVAAITSAQSTVVGGSVTLDGSASSDANGDVLSYAWQITSAPQGSGASLSSSTAQKPVLVPDAVGSYVVSLVVSDGRLSSNSASVTITVTGTSVSATATGARNDTGYVAGGYDASGAYVSGCANAIAGNDCNLGRDADSANNSNDDGHVGFRFQKIDAQGQAMLASATEWACVKDLVTGLVWENKTAANGMLTYTYIGDNSSGDASAYVLSVNAARLCGSSDWRLPTVEELADLVDYSVAPYGPTIDTAWFANTAYATTDSSTVFSTVFVYYWTSTVSLNNSTSNVWVVDFAKGVLSNGTTVGKRTEAKTYLRLVRSAS